MMKTKNDKEIINEQINHIYNNYYKDKIIRLCNKIKNDNFAYGVPFFMKETRYEDSYLAVLESNEYFIMLDDQSLINMCYLFDELGNIKKHTLSFIPPINTKTYIRVDFHDDEKSVHYKTHLHISTNDDDCRIPVSKVVFPNDFLFLILKYFYCDKSNFVNSLKIGKGKKVLDKNIKLFFAIGN